MYPLALVGKTSLEILKVLAKEVIYHHKMAYFNAVHVGYSIFLISHPIDSVFASIRSEGVGGCTDQPCFSRISLLPSIYGS